LDGAFDHQKERTDTQKVKDGCPKSNLSRRSQTMSRKSYSLFVVVIVVAVLALSQLACSGSGGGGDTSVPSDCKPGMTQTVDGRSCVAPTAAPAPTVAPKIQPTLDAASSAAKTAVQNAGKLMNFATSGGDVSTLTK